MAVKVLSADEVRRFADGPLHYEIWMFVSMRERIRSSSQQGGPKRTTQVEYNAFIESFVIHCRTLWEFFFNRTNSGHLRLIDYCPEWRPKKVLEQDYGRACDLAAHLSTRRLGMTRNQQQWRVNRIAREMMALIVEFCEKAVDRLSPEFVSRAHGYASQANMT